MTEKAKHDVLASSGFGLRADAAPFDQEGFVSGDATFLWFLAFSALAGVAVGFAAQSFAWGVAAWAIIHAIRSAVTFGVVQARGVEKSQPNASQKQNEAKP
jgi:hypothetical protein